MYFSILSRWNFGTVKTGIFVTERYPIFSVTGPDTFAHFFKLECIRKTRVQPAKKKNTQNKQTKTPVKLLPRQKLFAFNDTFCGTSKPTICLAILSFFPTVYCAVRQDYRCCVGNNII